MEMIEKKRKRSYKKETKLQHQTRSTEKSFFLKKKKKKNTKMGGGGVYSILHQEFYTNVANKFMGIDSTGKVDLK